MFAEIALFSAAPCAAWRILKVPQSSEGGMIRLETLIELKFINSSFSSPSSRLVPPGLVEEVELRPRAAERQVLGVQDAYNRWNRKPRPQLEPYKASLETCKVN